MKITIGTVVDGQIIVDGQPFAEGEKVTVLSRDEGESFQVSPAEKRFLLESIACADRNDVIDGDELLAELDDSN